MLFRSSKTCWRSWRSLSSYLLLPQCGGMNSRCFCSKLNKEKASLAGAIHVSSGPTDPDPEKKKKNPSLKSANFRRLLSLCHPESRTLAKAATALVLSTAVTIAIPAAFGKIIDISTGASLGLDPKVWLPVLGSAFFIGAAATCARIYYFTLASERVIARLRRSLFGSVISQEISFFDRHRTGDLLTRLGADTTEMAKSLSGMNLSNGLRNTVQLFGSLGFMFYLSPKLSMAVFGIIPIGYMGARVYGKYVKQLSTQVQDALGQATVVAEERLGNIRTVRGFAHEEKEKRRFAKEVEKVMNLACHAGTVNAIFFGSTTLTGNFTLLGVVAYASYLLQQGAITSGTLTSFLFYTVYLGMSVMNMTRFYSELMKSLGASERVFELIDRSPQISNTGGLTPASVVGHINFEKVRFRYPTRPDARVFESLTLDVAPGSVLAVVGASGSGKSTLTSLLLRFYDPLSGKVCIDGEDVRDLDLTWLRTNIGIVAQEPTLFAGTIAENIMYGLSDEQSENLINSADGKVPSEVIECAREANAHAFVTAFPDGYATLVGEKGVSLSGGQKQRIAIARALMKNPKILLLDEATSALDAESEQLVQEALERAMQNRTVIVIAHRLSTVQNADRIAVLEDGCVTEVGTHSELMGNVNGSYRQLMSIQLGLGG
eukprot:236851_1